MSAPPAPTEESFRLSGIELFGIFAFWTLLAVLTAANRLADQHEGFSAVPSAVPIALAFEQMYLWGVLTPPLFWLASRFNAIKGPPWSRILILIAIGLVAAFFVDLINSSLVQALQGHDRGLAAGGGGRFIGGGDGGGGGRHGNGPLGIFHGPMILNHFVIYCGILAAGFAREYSRRFRLHEKAAAQMAAETAQLQTQLAEARLSALNAQLNPHFLFNTLNAVSSLVERDPRGVRRMIARLSELLRYTLDGGTDHEVPLSQEISFLERYLEIMQVRFQGKLEIDMQTDDDASDAMVPSLILQPLVENAVKHGVDKIAAAGKIGIRARLEGQRLVLTVTDNGPGPAKIARLDDAGVGLANTRQRLEQLYGSEQSLALAEAPGGGTVARITIPYRASAELRTVLVTRSRVNQ
ncbi:MAG TPA: histidine kinase [Gemmatimonadaceae bacterium]|jgi:two-component sensor histidine kinase